ncbi:MAG: transcription-repair coupling factor, partial [Tomitella sp.]|nr:transcription-repair coupling factor [Tomitella sp.]
MSALAEVALSDSALREFADKAGRPELTTVAPTAARAFLAAALGRRAPVLLVTAGGREADDRTRELREFLGDAVAQFPSWETLPHERLSPGADTVGRRLSVLRRLARPDDALYGPPLQVVVTTVRSLVQPMAPGLGEIEPVIVREGGEYDFEALVARLSELAYTRVDMVGKRGEFAVRGGILDVFPPTSDHAVRVEFWGDEVTELRAFSVADQRSISESVVPVLIAPPCRELLLTDAVRERASELAQTHAEDAALVEMLDSLAQGIPAEGMEALIPALVSSPTVMLPDVLPEGSHVLISDPERVRTRATDLVKTGREFLDASWSAASVGADAPLDSAALNLGGSAYRSLTQVRESTMAAGVPWWTVSPLASGSDEEFVPELSAAPTARGS